MKIIIKKKFHKNPCNRCSIIIILGLFVLSQNVNSQSVYVPLNHWVYNFIERLETKHVIQGVLNETKPLSRKEIAECLSMVHRKIEQGYNLNKVEQQQLSFLNKEFKEELTKLVKHLKDDRTRIKKIRNNKYIKKFLPRIIYHNDRNFLSWEQDQFQLFFDPIFHHQRKYINIYSLSYTEKIFQFTNGMRIWGNLRDRLGFFIDARDNKEWGTKKYRLGNYTLPGLGFVRATATDFIYHDETDAYIKTGFKYINLTYGKFENYWGPGYTGSLILSNYATSYDQLKLDIEYKRFKFTSIYAYLIDYHDQHDDSLQQRKYLAGHRLEFTPWNWLSLGLTETVVFAGRSFEPAYLNPVMFFRSAEHYLGSPDNMMMGIDFKFTLFRNVKLYGELLIDDITSPKLGTGWYGNKLGFLAGLFNADFLTIENLDCNLEYVRIEPYVYSHIKSGNSYNHYGTILGHWLDPNSDLLFMQLMYRFSKQMTIACYASLQRHGANPKDKNVGGDVNFSFRSGIDSETVYFLDGDPEKNNSFGLDFSYEIFRNFYVKINYKYHIVRRFNVQDRKVISYKFFMSLGLNY